MIKNYVLEMEGWDLDSKTVAKLPVGTSLVAKRIDDEMDTYEMVVETQDGINIGMLEYTDSFSIAPFIDEELVTINSVELVKTTVVEGKTRSKDIIKVEISMDISYNDEIINEYQSFLGDILITNENKVLSLANIYFNDYEQDDIIEQTYMNEFVFSVPVDDDSACLFDIDFEEVNQDTFFKIKTLFNVDFTHCKIRACLKNDEEQLDVSLNEWEQRSVVELVNHYSIFNDEKALTPIIDN